MYPLRAVIFDLDALTDIEFDGHRVAFNAAFAAHGLDVEWSVGRYRQLLALGDERQRVRAELRKRGIASYPGAKVQEGKEAGDRVEVSYVAEKPATVAAEVCLIAVG